MIETMKKVLISAFFVFISIMPMLANDVVYLKNGCIIKGSITEIIPSTSITIQTIDGNSLVYQIDEIEKISKEDNTDDTMEQLSPKIDYLKRGFRGLLDIGFQYGVGDAEDIYNFSLGLTAGYQFNNMFYLGAGVAPTYYRADIGYFSNDGRFGLPIFSAFRFDFINYKVSPFLNARLGYYFDVDETEINGLYLSFRLGIRLKKISLSTGYEYYGYDDYTFSFPSLQIGFEF